MELEEDDYLEHYGILRRSGRYPWNSGGNAEASQATRNKAFLDYFDDLKRQGLSESEALKAFEISTTEYRAAKSLAKSEQKHARIAEAQRLKMKGVGNSEIGRRMGLNESSVRALLAPGAADKSDLLESTSNMLKEQVATKGLIDIGTGAEYHVAGVTKTNFGIAVARLREEGYSVETVPVPQVGVRGNFTNTKVLAPPGTTWGEIMKRRDEIQGIGSFSEDGGRSWLGLHPPIAISTKRVDVTYGPDGGGKLDGIIYVRPGVADVSLGNARYAQVRVQVGDGHYLKGMAMYKEGLPDGVDLMFHTNKESTGNKLDALKELKRMQDGEVDPDNPFGAIVRQIVRRESDGKEFVTTLDNRGLFDGTERVTSAMNIVNEEGSWQKWSKNLPSQMLSKQEPRLAKQQLDMTYERRQQEFDEITALTNPTVRKQLLMKFADSTESASVHLKAANMDRQGHHVILPITSMKPTEIYAPNYQDGERVALIRFPHGGTFEIPELVVNNNHPEAKRLLGPHPKDAVGIHHSVAERLSGADFDGDTVLVIPNGHNKIKSTPALEGLKDFDPRAKYKEWPGMKVMTNTQTEMGKISNLITDMTIQRANTQELARAVRHSMVVIDAEKHHLDYRQSALDNNIPQLKAKYQLQPDGRKGASTLISRAKSRVDVPDRKERKASEGGPIDKETGKRVFTETGAIDFRSGKPKTIQSRRLDETDDAHTLSSGTPMERLYANHSNKLKGLANDARRDAVNTPPSVYNPSAKVTYKAEVQRLDSALALAKRNAPLERQAQIAANTVIKVKKDANPDMDRITLKKVEAQALNEARTRMGAKKHQIVISDKEWDAIQAGAITNHKLNEILTNADIDRVKELATPRSVKLMTPAKTSRARTMLASGATRAEVASALGVSLTTLDVSMKGDGDGG